MADIFKIVEDLEYETLHGGSYYDEINNENNYNMKKLTALGNSEELKTAIDNNLNLDMLNSEQENLLHLAVRNKNFKTVKFLVKAGINLDILNGYGENAFHISYNLKFNKICFYLIKHMVVSSDEFKSEYNTLLEREGLISKLKVEPKDKDKNNFEILFYKYGMIHDVNMMKFLLKSNKIHIIDNKPFLYDLFTYGDIKVKKLLIKNGLNTKDNKYLHIACRCCKCGTSTVIKKLIKMGASVNSQDENGKYPIWILCNKKDTPIEEFKILIENGADLHVINEKGESLLDYCIKNKKYVLKLLLAANIKYDSSQEILIKDVLKINDISTYINDWKSEFSVKFQRKLRSENSKDTTYVNIPLDMIETNDTLMKEYRLLLRSLNIKVIR